MEKEQKGRVSIVISLCLILLGWAEWMDPAHPLARWDWLQDLTNNLFGQQGFAKFLIISGGALLIWDLLPAIRSYLTKEEK